MQRTVKVAVAYDLDEHPKSKEFREHAVWRNLHTEHGVDLAAAIEAAKSATWEREDLGPSFNQWSYTATVEVL